LLFLSILKYNFVYLYITKHNKPIPMKKENKKGIYTIVNNKVLNEFTLKCSNNGLKQTFVIERLLKSFIKDTSIIIQ